MHPVLMALTFGRVLGEIDPSPTPSRTDYLLPQFAAQCAIRAGFDAVLSTGARHFGRNLQILRYDAPVAAIGTPSFLRVPWNVSATTERCMVYA